MRIFRTILFTVLLLAFGTVVAVAQTDLPDQITPALNDLSSRLGQSITVDDVETVTWSAERYGDTSLGCLQEGQAYAQVATDGYQFNIIYGGQVYDYRVSQDGTIVVLCDVQAAEDNPAQPTVQPCGPTITVTRGDTLSEIAARCGTTVQAIVDANDNIEEASDVLFAGTVLNIPGQGGDDDLARDLPPVVAIFPLSGPPGSTVDVIGNGYPANTEVVIGVGRPFTEYQVVERPVTNADGAVRSQFTVPQYTPDDDLVVVVEVQGPGGARATSHTFDVTAGGAVTPVPPGQATFDSADIYLIALGDAGQRGEQIGCDDSVVPLEVSFAPTVAPLTAALETMFGGQYGQTDLYNVFSQSSLSIDRIDIIGTTAQIYLTGQLALGGACDTPRVEAQIRQTALQFATINSAEIYLNGQPIDSVLSTQGG